MLRVRIALLQKQLDDAAKEIEEMKAARRRQAEMVCANVSLCYGCSAVSFQCCHAAGCRTSIPAKARFGRPYGKNGCLGGHIGETGSRNTAATQKINSIFDPGFLFAPSDSFSLGRTVSPQYIRQKTAVSVAI